MLLRRQVRSVRRQLASGTRCAHGNDHLSCSRLVIITIAFNNPTVVLKQALRLGRLLTDDFDWYVVDNSTNPGKRAPIAEATAQGNGTYLCVDRTPYATPGSASHGFALDVAWRVLACGSGRRHVALLDHDVFPVRQTSLLDSIGGSALAGMLQTRDDRWYGWPGLLVMDVTQFEAHRVTFMPGGGVDTGGWVPRALRGDASRARLAEMNTTLVQVRETDGSKQSDYVMMIGDWVHWHNASGWRDVPDPDQRRALLETLLDSFE
jgi:hypothetical protein